MLSLAVLALVLLGGASAANVESWLTDITIANSKANAMNPLCPTRLSNDQDRYKCYSKTVRALYERIEQADYSTPPRMRESAERIVELLEPDCMGRSTGGAFTNASWNAAYLTAAFPAMKIVGNWAAKPVMDLFTSAGLVAGFGANYMRYNINGKGDNWTLWGVGKFHPVTNRLAGYDVDFRRYSELLYSLSTVSNNAESQAAFQRLMANQICITTTQQCVGANKQWDSYEQCVDTLAPKRFIAVSTAVLDDTLLCRLIFSVMLPFNHGGFCANVGPTGGNSCLNIPYQTYYSFFDKNYFVGYPKLMTPSKYGYTYVESS